jgi:hypothetical protein
MKKIVVAEILFGRMEKKAIALRSKGAVTHVYLQVAVEGASTCVQQGQRSGARRAARRRGSRTVSPRQCRPGPPGSGVDPRDDVATAARAQPGERRAAVVPPLASRVAGFARFRRSTYKRIPTNSTPPCWRRCPHLAAPLAGGCFTHDWRRCRWLRPRVEATPPTAPLARVGAAGWASCIRVKKFTPGTSKYSSIGSEP